MAREENTVVVARPIQEVFDYLADGTNDKEWRKGVVEISLVSPTTGLGASYRQVVQGPGRRRIPADFRITEFQPPNRLAFEVTVGPARPTGVYELSAQAPGVTKVRFVLDLVPRGFMKLMSPMISAQVKREVAALDNVKRILESRPPG